MYVAFVCQNLSLVVMIGATCSLYNAVYYFCLLFVVLSVKLQEFFVKVFKLGITEFYSILSQIIYGAIIVSLPQILLVLFIRNIIYELFYYQHRPKNTQASTLLVIRKK